MERWGETGFAEYLILPALVGPQAILGYLVSNPKFPHQHAR